MVELKTLKDMDFSEQMFSYVKNSVEDKRIKNRLRQEAIKWIKKIKKDYRLTKDEMPIRVHIKDNLITSVVEKLSKDFDNKRAGFSTIAFIKYFFNITEEDLK